MTTVRWTRQAVQDVEAIRAFIARNSPHYSSVVVARLIKAVDRLRDFPHSGRIVPEFEQESVREVIERPYRIIYRLTGAEVHILAVHHSAKRVVDSEPPG